MFLINVAHFDVSKTYKIFIKHYKFFISQETFSIVSCPIGDTSLQDFSIMTLQKTEGSNLRVLGRSIEPFRAYGSYHVI